MGSESGRLESRIRAALLPFAGAMPVERFDAMVAAAVRAVLEERGPEVVRMDMCVTRATETKT